MGNINYSLPPKVAEVPDFWNLIFISGEITDDTGVEIAHKLLSIEMINKTQGTCEPVTMFINSLGGVMSAAWQICDVMDFIETPVHTIGLGTVCSAGLIILMNGEIGERKVTDRTQIMSHIYLWGGGGNHHALMNQTDEFKNMHDRMVQHYTECTGLDKDVIEDELLGKNDKWLTGAQAKKYRLIDDVARSNKTKKLTALKKIMKVKPKTKRKPAGRPKKG